ncbi:MAG: hypothetical protein ACRDQI_01265 [Pseudonocardiaceae bacterium]
MSTTTANAPAVSAVPAAEDQRERFYRLMPELLREDPRLALVLAEIGAATSTRRPPRRWLIGWSTSASASN